MFQNAFHVAGFTDRRYQDAPSFPLSLWLVAWIIQPSPIATKKSQLLEHAWLLVKKKMVPGQDVRKSLRRTRTRESVIAVALRRRWAHLGTPALFAPYIPRFGLPRRCFALTTLHCRPPWHLFRHRLRALLSEWSMRFARRFDSISRPVKFEKVKLPRTVKKTKDAHK